jgi:transposase-like protein
MLRGRHSVEDRQAAREYSERGSTSIRSAAYRRAASEIGRKENTSYVWVQQQFVGVKSVKLGSRVIWSFNRIPVITDIGYLMDVQATMPNASRFVNQMIEPDAASGINQVVPREE